MRDFIVAAFIFLFTFSCSPSETTFSVEMINGVRNVLNVAPQWGEESKLALEFVQIIGGIDATDENYKLFKAFDATKDADGNIYVLDSGNFRIQKFDPEGIHVATIGKQGEGPGEFKSSNYKIPHKISNYY